MTPDTGWSRVARALLGRWPNQAAAWDEEGIAAYVEELQADGLTPETALTALRRCGPGQKFPPSVPELAGIARSDPDRPTFDEILRGLYAPGGVFGVKRSSVVLSPWVSAFVAYVGSDWLRYLPIDDPVDGKWRRREIEEAYERFLQAADGRELAQIAQGRRGAMGKLDPVAALGLAQPHSSREE